MAKEIYMEKIEREASKDAVEQETRNRLVESVKFSFEDLRKFLDSDKETALIERNLTLEDLEALRVLPYEVRVLKNQYGVFSWRGEEEEVATPFIFHFDRKIAKAMFNSNIFLDMHNHPRDKVRFANDRSFPSIDDMQTVRVHDIIIVGKNGIGITSPILHAPAEKKIRFGDVSFMYGTFLRGEPYYYDSDYINGDDWLRFLEATGARHTFYPWENTDYIRKNILERHPQDASYRTWMNSENPYQRAASLRVFDSMYSDQDFTADPRLFETLGRFCNDSDAVVKKRADEMLERIRKNIEYRQKHAK